VFFLCGTTAGAEGGRVGDDTAAAFKLAARSSWANAKFNVLQSRGKKQQLSPIYPIVVLSVANIQRGEQ
jgi:hypothetical protein